MAKKWEFNIKSPCLCHPFGGPVPRFQVPRECAKFEQKGGQKYSDTCYVQNFMIKNNPSVHPLWTAE